MDNRQKLQSIEGTMQDLCLKLSVLEARHLRWDNTEDRQRQLAQLVIKSLTKLLDGGEVGGTPPRPDYESGPGSPSNALSLEASNLSTQDRAANALAHRMGIYTPPELR
jgi:hypothetical protein